MISTRLNVSHTRARQLQDSCFNAIGQAQLPAQLENRVPSSRMLAFQKNKKELPIKNTATSR